MHGKGTFTNRNGGEFEVIMESGKEVS